MSKPNESPIASWRRTLGPVEYALEHNGVLTQRPEAGTEGPDLEVTVDELHAKIERGDQFLLAMAMDRRRFERAHIPGSIDGDTLFATATGLSRDTEIIVYCTGPGCVASRIGAELLREAGFTNVRRFSGGLAAWAAAGLAIASGSDGLVAAA